MTSLPLLRAPRAETRRTEAGGALAAAPPTHREGEEEAAEKSKWQGGTDRAAWRRGKSGGGRAFTPGHRRLRAQSHPCSAEGFGGIVAPAVCTVSDAKRDNQTVLEFPAFKFPAMSSPLRTTATRIQSAAGADQQYTSLPDSSPPSCAIRMERLGRFF